VTGSQSFDRQTRFLHVPCVVYPGRCRGMNVCTGRLPGISGVAAT